MNVSTASEMQSPSSKRGGEEIRDSAKPKRQDLSPAPGNVAGSGVSAASPSREGCGLCLDVAIVRCGS
eukprot:10969965-Prorocentrum_lima.AAC.1